LTLQHSLKQNDTASSVVAARRLQELTRVSSEARKLWWYSDDSDDNDDSDDWLGISSAVSAVSSAASSVVSAASSAVSAVSNGFSWKWGDSKSYEKSLLKWNYDSFSRKPIPKTENLLGDNVKCKDCYGYIGANVKFNLEMDWWNLEELEVSAYAGVVIGIDIQIISPQELVNRYQTTVLQPVTDYGDIKFSISGIPVAIGVSGSA